ncbi:MAG: DUF6421 family protein [Rhodoluna sp.]|nr:DUF6421 family protein [Rhodoluna sp.]
MANILIDQAHNQAWAIDADDATKMNPANPADASYGKLATSLEASGHTIASHKTGPIDLAALSEVDLLIIPHASADEWEKTLGNGSPILAESELVAIEAFVADGGGLLILGETEQPKYGNNFNQLSELFGITIANATVQDPERSFKDVATWIRPEFERHIESDFSYRVEGICLYRAGALEASATSDSEVIMRSSESASPKAAPLGIAVKHQTGRVIVLADSDLFGDDSIEDLDNRQFLLNITGWLANARVVANADLAKKSNWALTDKNWLKLQTTVEALRPMQAKDGSINTDEHSSENASKLVDDVLSSIEDLAPKFAHQAEYFAAVKTDIENWRSGGFGVPDYYDSLQLFRPDLNRRNNVETLAVFSMYTQNGNPNRNLEALVINTFWPDWLAAKEQKYNNPAFIPIEFLAFTSAYDTNSAVFFPETVATREVATYFWGGIFCDREAARFRMVSKAAKELLYLPLPADAERLISDQYLAQETYVLWDLIHDRTHSRGDLPFDPFMIKQRMPFWMYALEELRCDLSTFRETLVLDAEGDRLAKYMRYAILFDRLFRFPITGDRVRNYDGLGGQIIFAHLHKTGALQWTDNRLAFDWDKVTEAVVELCEQVEALYHDGINRSRLAQWIAAYEFVSGLVQPHPASNWAKGADHLPTEGELREMVNLVLDDEFPLNVFYDTLNRNLSDVIKATKGITA